MLNTALTSRLRLPGGGPFHLLIASLGGSLEFYDFVVYGFFAQYIAARFFPASDSLISMLLTFSVMAIGSLLGARRSARWG